MKLIEMKCPNCDAPLSVNADRDEAFCRHCNTTFLIEGAPKSESNNRSNTTGRSTVKQVEPEEGPTEATVEFEKAKSELPESKPFAGSIGTRPRTKADKQSIKMEIVSEVPGKTVATETAVPPSGSSENRATKRFVAVAIAVAVVLLIVIVASAGTCSAHGSRSSASPAVQETSSNASSGSALGAGTTSSSEASSTPSASSAATQEFSGSTSSTPGSSSTTKDGFPCNLDSTATFSGVTIPIDSTWKDNSPVWDWRHKAFSYTAGSATMEDVQISISTFTGGDTKDALSFMKDYADFGPIFLEFGEYTVKSRDARDGITCTRIEGVDSHYESSFEVNPPTKYETIRKMHADDVVRCVCLVGYAEDGTGFAVAVALRGSADNDECLYSANKILDGVTFTPSECNIDSNDLWLYEVQH